jgi:hypothetical protein
LYFCLYCFAFIYPSFLLDGWLRHPHSRSSSHYLHDRHLLYYGSEELRYTVSALAVTAIVLQFPGSFPYEQAIHTRVGIYYGNLSPHVIVQAYSYGKVLRHEYKMEILPLICHLSSRRYRRFRLRCDSRPIQNQFIKTSSSLGWQWFGL